MKKILPILVACACLASCVSTKNFNSMKAEAMRYQNELRASQQANREITSQIEKMTLQQQTVEQKYDALQRDHAVLSDQAKKQQEALGNTANTLEHTKTTNQDLSARMDELVRQQDELARERDRLRAERADFQAMNDSLTIKYQQLAAEGSAEATRMLRQLEANQNELTARQKRVAELEQMLRARDEALDGIRRKVADALLGFEGKGLTVARKDGKVYVSMDEKLLFKSGSYEIDPNGARAVKDLATVLAQNPDINVMVEGHTDDVPYKANGQLQDNLDLSAKRATTVVRLLLENKTISPSRIIAAGRGSSLPVAAGKSAEARQKNRRTEVILTPKLDELMQLMEK